MQARLLTVFLLASGAWSTARAGAPDWLPTAGRSAKYPARSHLTGFGVSEMSVDGAKSQAAADLAKRLLVRIEQEVTDVSVEKNGVASYSVAATTRSTTDVRLSGLAYETHSEGGRHYALAILERAQAARERRAQRALEAEKAAACIASGARLKEEKKTGEALSTYLSCRGPLTAAIEHEAVARSISGDSDAAALGKLVEQSQEIDDTIRGLFARPATSLAAAAENIAVQLSMQGVTSKARASFAPLTYGTTPFSSILGAQLASDIERALAKTGPVDGAAKPGADLAIKGTYFEAGDMVSFKIIAREASSGRMVAGADAVVPLASIPKELPLKPQNFSEALREQRLLASGEEVSGDLRVELWTNRGDRGLVLHEGDELKLYMRVNQPAYVRLVYLLANRTKVMLEQAYYIDASKVNRAVEYPDSFVVSPPFGIEQVYAVAFTEKPAPLPTVERLVDGETYEVVGESATLVRHRGLKKAAKKNQTSEAVLSITTTPR